MENSNQNPFLSLEQLFDKGISYLKSEFFEFYENTDIQKEDRENGIICINQPVGISDAGEIEYAVITWTFESHLNSKLTLEKLNALKIIDSHIISILKNGIAIEPYLEFIFLRINNLKFISHQKFAGINTFSQTLDDMTKDICAKYMINEMIIEAETNSDRNIDVVSLRDEDLVDSILSYFIGQNEAREQIMNVEDYNSMKSTILLFVEKSVFPKEIKKLPPLKISKQLLRFSFWVLHKHLYASKRTNLKFLSLVKEMFSDFDNWEFQTLRKKFGNKDKVTFRGQKFIPEIIKKEFRSLD